MVNASSNGMDDTLEKTKSAVKHMLVGASMAGIIYSLVLAQVDSTKISFKIHVYGQLCNCVGATGATWGAILATVRNESIKFYAASMGANFFLLSSTYIAFEEIIADKMGKRDLTTGAAAGAITGGFYAGLIGGRLRGLQGAAAGAAVGAAVILGREQFHNWRLSKAVERYEEKYGATPEVYYPNTDILVETKQPVREVAFPSLLPKSIKISDEEIERRIQARVEELRQEEREGKHLSENSK